jgi:hypothetical protein
MLGDATWVFWSRDASVSHTRKSWHGKEFRRHRAAKLLHSCGKQPTGLDRVRMT